MQQRRRPEMTEAENAWLAQLEAWLAPVAPIEAAPWAAAAPADALATDPSPIGQPPSGPDAQVFLSSRPADQLFGAQWHLSFGNGAGINLRHSWTDHTGRGISIATIDDGFDHGHAELRGGYALTRDRDFRANDTDAAATTADRHGTAVMGVLGADLNGAGVVGVAHDATLVGLRMGFGAAGSPGQAAAALREGARSDVVNSSWGYTEDFQDNFNSFLFRGSELAMEHGAAAGRGGLGTVYVFAAGNSRAQGDNTNHHNHQNSLHSLTVGATDSAGRIANFSSPGASILVSAPGVNITTTDLTGTGGYARGDTAGVSGTSFAAPVVSGLVALMLDANARLGWRDVHEILAYTARQTDPANATWKFNAARDFNGGGLHTSTDFGFGLVDAHAAVRLAETWGEVSTSANMMRASAKANTPFAVPDRGSVQSSLAIGQDMVVDRIEVALDLRHSWRGDLRVSLVSPGGTESVLIDRPGLAPGSAGTGSSHDNIIFDLTSTQFWGEAGRGQWTLRVQDLKAGDVGQVVSWRLELFGDAAGANDIYVYTDEFATLGARPGRRQLDDRAGLDTINASAVTTASVIDLTAGATIAGHFVGFSAGTVIERAFGGDAADVLRGNASANLLWGGRGDDVLAGRAGADSFVFGVRSGRDRIEDFAIEDEVLLVDGVRLAGLSGSVATLSDGATITAANGWVWSTADFVLRDSWMV